MLSLSTKTQKKKGCWVATDVSVGERDGLHEVDTLCEHLDQGEDVAGFDRVAQCVQPRRHVGTFLPGKALLGVLGYDEVLPRLPAGEEGHRSEFCALWSHLYAKAVSLKSSFTR